MRINLIYGMLYSSGRIYRLILLSTSVRITSMNVAIIAQIAQETGIPENSVSATVSLLEKGSTGPFIVHYRKEAIGGLDEHKVRSIQERLTYYREVNDQRAALIKLLTEQGKLTDELQSKIDGSLTKTELDDLHHQFKPKKKSRATEAIEKGLEPLADFFWNQESDTTSVEEHINVFVDPAKGVSTQEQALQGAVDIIAERICENVEYRKTLREILCRDGFVVSTVVPAKVGQKTKYNMYYERKESVTTIPSHRVLAIRRGCKEGILMSSIEGDSSKAIEFLLNSIIKEKESIFAPILDAAVRESYNRILRPLIETKVRTQLKERADREAIRVFQENLSNLLLSPPAGPIVVMGIDWGKGDECSVTVVNEKGAFLDGAKVRFTTNPKSAPVAEPQPQEPIQPEPQIQIETGDSATAEAAAPETPATEEIISEQTSPVAEFVEAPAVPEESITSEAAPVEPVETSIPEPVSVVPENSPVGNNFEETRKILRDLIIKHSVRAIAIGTGTGARELETALREIVTQDELGDILIAAVNDAGIAIYSSSRIAREEFPDWNASARCAVSLARRLQDPLAELVKIDPKLIGVGQYQHDVDQKELHRGLLQTVQYCVNKVGVNPNTAGESLLRYISGLNEKLARRIVAFRSTQGPFRSRQSIISAIGMDANTFQQSAAFLRIPDGESAIDRTAVHPESYPIVEKMASTLGVGIPDLIGNRELVSSLKIEEFITESAGIPTLNDIKEELLRPGRDPRKTFKVPKFRPDVKEMSDLQPGMTLEGAVTNVTNFGAFIDIGVRQDGLVHLSQMSNRFIHDPREAVKVGDVVQVKVISVEPETKRIGLSMKALMPSLQRRRKKPQRRSAKPQVPARQSEEAANGKSAGAEAANEGNAPSAPVRPKSNKPYEGPPRNKKKGARKPERTENQQQEKESGPKAPEPSLQEKIAILQSKFRRIN
jgi:protein Tex